MATWIKCGTMCLSDPFGCGGGHPCEFVGILLCWGLYYYRLGYEQLVAMLAVFCVRGVL